MFLAATASPLVKLGIPGLAVAVGATFVALVAWGARRTGKGGVPVAAAALGVGGLAVAALAAARSGVLLRFDTLPPPAAGLFVAVLLTGFALGRSPVGAAFAALPLPVVVGFQAFRFPLELVMHRAATDGVMPPQMSFGECNFDVVTGIAAIVVSVGLATGRLPRSAARWFQRLGVLTLSAILVIALLSTPMFRAFGDEPSRVNTWVFSAPYVLLPATLVLLAIVGHVALARALAAPEGDRAGTA